MERDDVIWLAGLLEGEGCFLLNRPRTRNSRLSVQVALAMADLDVVERAATIMGTNVRPMRAATNKHSAIWRTVASSARAEQVMRAVRPLMGRRRSARIDFILSHDLSHY